jgi:integrase
LRQEARDLIFADNFGRPWNPGSISNAFDRLARDAMLSTTRLHDARHSAATWLLQSGIDVRTVAAVLGHSTPVTTLNTYAHVMPGAEAKAVETIAERLSRAESVLPDAARQPNGNRSDLTAQKGQ